MLKALLLLFAPLGILTRPATFASQLIGQFYDGPPYGGRFYDGPYSDDPLYDSPITTNIPASAAHPDTAVKKVHQFKQSEGLVVENLAVRQNGQLIITIVSKPYVYTVDPTIDNPPARLVHKFPNATGMTGIAEISPDVFAVIAGKWNITSHEGEPGSFRLWSIDMNYRKPKVESIAPITTGGGLNGMTVVETIPGMVFIAGSADGMLLSVNLTTGDAKVVGESPLWEPTEAFGLGVNGIQSHDGMLYYSNSAQGHYGRVRIDDGGGMAGEVEIISRAQAEMSVGALDDLALDWEGNAWIATHPNRVNEITLQGKGRNITGEPDGLEMTQPTSAQFGRGSPKQERTLYVTTSGGRTMKGGEKVGGQVFAIDLCLF